MMMLLSKNRCCVFYLLLLSTDPERRNDVSATVTRFHTPETVPTLLSFHPPFLFLLSIHFFPILFVLFPIPSPPSTATTTATAPSAAAAGLLWMHPLLPWSGEGLETRIPAPEQRLQKEILLHGILHDLQDTAECIRGHLRRSRIPIPSSIVVGGVLCCFFVQLLLLLLFSRAAEGSCTAAITVVEGCDLLRGEAWRRCAADQFTLSSFVCFVSFCCSLMRFWFFS